VTALPDQSAAMWSLMAGRPSAAAAETAAENGVDGIVRTPPVTGIRWWGLGWAGDSGLMRELRLVGSNPKSGAKVSQGHFTLAWAITRPPAPSQVDGRRLSRGKRCSGRHGRRLAR